MSKRVSPASLARRALDQLAAEGDPRTAASARRFFKSHERVVFFGVKNPHVRRLAGEYFQSVKDSWTVDDALDLADRMVRRREMEAKMFGIFFLGRFKRTYGPPLFQRAYEWLDENHCDNWAAVDTLCPVVIAPLLQAHPSLVPRVVRWSGSPNLWVRRASLVSFVPLVRHGREQDAAYVVVEHTLSDDHDLMHKACGWLLREAGKADVKRLEAFLLAEGPRIPRTTVRYAIERFPERRRKQLLQATRPG